MKSNFIVRIPEPCHEDWNSMKPDEKGRFCKSCSKSVYDFTNKTDSEIHRILSETKGQHICGHFKKTQIDRPLTISFPMPRLSYGISHARTFAIALFFVFGTFLFSCTNENGKTVGKIEMENTELLTGVLALPPVPETPEQIAITGEVAVPESISTTLVNGGICFHELPEERTNVPLFPEANDEEYTHVKGEVVQTLKGDTTYALIPPEINEEKYFLGGLVAIDYEEDRADTTKDQETEIQTSVDTETTNTKTSNNKIESSVDFSCSAYPNPSTGSVNISYELRQKCPVQIDLYNMEGKAVMNIVPKQDQHTGKYIIPTDLSKLPNGTYICRMNANGLEKNTKIILWK